MVSLDPEEFCFGRVASLFINEIHVNTIDFVHFNVRGLRDFVQGVNTVW